MRLLLRNLGRCDEGLLHDVIYIGSGWSALLTWWCSCYNLSCWLPSSLLNVVNKPPWQAKRDNMHRVKFCCNGLHQPHVLSEKACASSMY